MMPLCTPTAAPCTMVAVGTKEESIDLIYFEVYELIQGL